MKEMGDHSLILGFEGWVNRGMEDSVFNETVYVIQPFIVVCLQKIDRSIKMKCILTDIVLAMLLPCN